MVFCIKLSTVHTVDSVKLGDDFDMNELKIKKYESSEELKKDFHEYFKRHWTKTKNGTLIRLDEFYELIENEGIKH